MALPQRSKAIGGKGIAEGAQGAALVVVATQEPAGDVFVGVMVAQIHTRRACKVA